MAQIAKASIDVTFSVSLEVDTEVLTKEVMDNYERYFFDLDADPDLMSFDTQL